MKKFDELPVEIQEKMLERQFQQTGKRDPEVFCDFITTMTGNVGFLWANSPEGHRFWEDVIRYDNYELFYQRYPKTPQWNNCKLYPKEKVMMVSFSAITEDNPGEKRVVFMEKNGLYYAWAGVKTIEQAKNAKGVTPWSYAAEINHQAPKTIELTIDQIAAKFGVSPNTIKIKK